MNFRMTDPLPNAMTLGPYYDTSGCDEGCCHYCGNIYSYDEMSEIAEGHICDDCKAECPACSDWMAGEHEVVIDGCRWHKACALDAGYEDEEERQAAYDAYIDSKIEERKENRRIA